MQTDYKTKTESHPQARSWLKRGGVAVFLFFLLKGIGWLVLFTAVAFGLMNEETVQKIKDAIPFF